MKRWRPTFARLWRSRSFRPANDPANSHADRLGEQIVHRAGHHAKEHSRWFLFRRLALPPLIGSMVAVICLVGMPGMFHVSLPEMLLNQPDLTGVIIFSGLLTLINGLLFCGANARDIYQSSQKRHSNQGPDGMQIP